MIEVCRNANYLFFSGLVVDALGAECEGGRVNGKTQNSESA